jgi:ketosteroid isomerase-like protein
MPTPLTDEAAIAATLRRYEMAYESLDVNLIREVYPTLTQEQVERLTRDFAALNSYRLDFSGVKMNITGDTAIVTCTIIRRIAPRVGRTEGGTTPTTIRLRKQAGGWAIESLSGR